MDKRGNVVVALLLIGFGLVFLFFNFIPGLTMQTYWPFIFFILAAGFYVPPLVIPGARKGLSSLHPWHHSRSIGFDILLQHTDP
jgi:hypothetical protein